MSLKELEEEALKNDAVREEYDKLASEFQQIDQALQTVLALDKSGTLSPTRES